MLLLFVHIIEVSAGKIRNNALSELHNRYCYGVWKVSALSAMHFTQAEPKKD